MASMVGGVLGGGKIDSVKLPYVCDNCGAATESIVSFATICAHELEESRPCVKCRSTAMVEEGVLEELEFLAESK